MANFGGTLARFAVVAVAFGLAAVPIALEAPPLAVIAIAAALFVAAGAIAGRTWVTALPFVAVVFLNVWTFAVLGNDWSGDPPYGLMLTMELAAAAALAACLYAGVSLRRLRETDHEPGRARWSHL